MDMRYLRSLSKRFPNIAMASTEIINLSAIMNLPKGTEHYVSDLHGENEQFLHVLKNGSGAIKRKIEEQFGNTLSYRDKRSLATLIYYPEKKLELMQKQEEKLDDWYKITLYRLIQIARSASTKYTRSKVRKALPSEFAYVFEELIYEESTPTKHAYYDDIIHTIIRIDRAPACIIALCELIQRLIIDHLHVLGDIYDRGSGPHIIMDTLINYHSVDIQWGNHDVTWMAAASGHMACIATILRIAARYGELDVIEDGYGINLIPLLRFVSNTYKNVPGKSFNIHYDESTYDLQYEDVDKRMQKALAIIQFKLEGQIIKAHPEFHMDNRLLLDKIDYENKTVTLEGVVYPINDTDFPTVDPEDPYRLSDEEQAVMERIQGAFLNSEKLQRHIKFLYEKGSLYQLHNNNLLFHGCVPLDENGNFLAATLNGKHYSGKALYDKLDSYARKAYYMKPCKKKSYCQDVMWFIWCSPSSPLFGKDKMATFERYFIDDESTWHEEKNDYYKLYDNEDTIKKIMDEFGIDYETGHIINGHVPVKCRENPVKCNGKLFVIDGGFSKAYQKTTGIAGYTLVCNSYGIQLASHKPFSSAEEAVRNETDVHTETIEVENFQVRKLVKHTDAGKEMKESIEDLEELLQAYQLGLIREQTSK
jgi:fructose-1,6-bisphosphatase-3